MGWRGKEGKPRERKGIEVKEEELIRGENQEQKEEERMRG